jgi:PIN domain nuclease of toxin-antitoxin system
MRLLLDTHVILWWLGESKQLTAEAKTAILRPENSVFVSAVSVFEVRLKETIRKMTLARDWWERLRAQDFEPLAFTVEHADITRNLPLLHRDPFDRMLIARRSTREWSW